MKEKKKLKSYENYLGKLKAEVNCPKSPYISIWSCNLQPTFGRDFKGSIGGREAFKICYYVLPQGYGIITVLLCTVDSPVPVRHVREKKNLD